MAANEQHHQPDLGVKLEGQAPTRVHSARAAVNAPDSKDVFDVLSAILASLAQLTRQLACCQRSLINSEERLADDELKNAKQAIDTSLQPTPSPAEESLEPNVTEALTRSERRKTKYAPKVSFYQDPEDTDRVRGAILHTMHLENSRTLSDFIHNAVMEKVEELENKYNNRKPFPNTKAGELPQGRPWGK